MKYRFLIYFLSLALLYSLPGKGIAQCESASVSLPDDSQPVVNPSNSYCVSFTIDPSVTGHPTGVCLDLYHTWQGDLSIRVSACGNTLMLLTRPGGGSCGAGSPFGSSSTVDGNFCFEDAGTTNPDNGLPFGGGNFGLSNDPCGVNTVDSFDELGDNCGDDPYELTICITDHAFGNSGSASNIIPVFPIDPLCGCTDPDASNYDPDANVDDGSCEYINCDLSITPTITNTACGLSNGSISLLISGGSGSYLTAWSNGVNQQQTITDLDEGNYTVTITDQSNPDCFETLSLDIVNEGNLEANYVVEPTSCGLNNGSIEIVVNEGSGDYSYNWSASLPNGTPLQTDLAPGQYTVEIIDNVFGCELSFIIDIEGSQPLELTEDIQHTSCGQNDGSIEINVINGSGDYTFNWSEPGLNGALINNLPSGTYSVTVEDNITDCQVFTSIEIEESSPIEIAYDVTATTCGLDNGTINIIVIGDGTSYNYYWSDPSLSNSPTQDDLSSGIYGVTVENELATCSEEIEIVVNDSESLQIEITAYPTSCGESNGSAVIEVFNGSGNYSIVWSQFPGNNDLIINELPEGNYSVEVEDLQTGCIAISEFIIEGSQPLDAVINESPTYCGESNGSAEVIPLNGSGNFSYVWSEGNLQGSYVENLAPGLYSVTVIDNLSECTIELDIFIDASQPLVIEYTHENTTCGENNGIIDINVIQGDGPFVYFWSGPVEANSPYAEDLPPGDYSIEVSDLLGNCNEVIDISIQESGLINEELSIQHPTCGYNNGSVEIIIEGQSLYEYYWPDFPDNESNILDNIGEGSYQVVITDVFTECIKLVDFELVSTSDPLNIEVQIEHTSCNYNNGELDIEILNGSGFYSIYLNGNEVTDTSLSGLESGTYDISIIDNNSLCEWHNVYFIEPSEDFTINLFSTDTECGLENGQILVEVNNGSGFFEYQWGHDYDLNDPLAANLEGGHIYEVTVVDLEENCTTSESIYIEDSERLNIELLVSQLTCGPDDASVEIEVTQGSGEYEYFLNGIQHDGDNIFQNLEAGEHELIIVDLQTNCQIDTAVFIAPIDHLEVVCAVINDETNFGDEDGEVEISIQNGSAPFLIEVVYPADNLSFSTNETNFTLDSLSPGLYDIYVYDDDGCSSSCSYFIESGPCGLSVLVDSVFHPTCNGFSNGYIALDIESEYAYQIDWSGPVDTIDSELGNDLPAGIYTIVVQDSLGCQVQVQVELFEPNALDLLCNVLSHETARGLNDGSFRMEISGGIRPYSIEIESDSLDQAITFENEDDLILEDLSPGEYNITVVDSNGCEQECLIEILAGECGLNAEVLVEPLSCHNSNDGSVTIIANNIIDDYNLHLPDLNEEAVVNNLTIDSLAAGEYEIVIEDSVGCTDTLTFELFNPLQLELQCIVAHESEALAADGEIQINLSNFNAPVTVSIDPNVMPPIITSEPEEVLFQNLEPGFYTILVVDSNGCSVECSNAVNPADCDLSVEILSMNHLSCYNSNDGMIEVDIIGGSAPFEYSWMGTGTFEDNLAYDLASGKYEIQVSDVRGCTDILEVVLDEPEPLSVLSQIEPPKCGLNNGSIALSALGGTGDYSILWNSGQTDLEIDQLSEGEYSFTINDENNCTMADTFLLEMEQPPDLQLVDLNHITCYGHNDGYIEVAVEVFTEDYFIEWSNGIKSTNSISELVSGIYEVSITDDNECSDVLSVELEQPDSLTINSSISHPDCNASNGQIELSVTGGHPPYTYSSNLNQDGPIFRDLSPGDYNFMVIDSANCSKAVYLSLDELNTPESNAGPDRFLTCIDSVVVLESPLVFNEGFSYEWVNLTTEENIGQNVLSIEVNRPGIYGLIVTDDESGCSSIDTIVVEDLIVAYSNVEWAYNDISCFGENDGSILITQIEGGTPPFDMYINEDTFDYEQYELSPDTYDIKIIDALGCEYNISNIVITEPSKLELDLPEFITTLENQPLVIQPIFNEPNRIDLIKWSDEMSILCEPCMHLDLEVTPTDDMLYTLEVWDANGCYISDSTQVIVSKDRNIYIPNAFSPNSDATNDTFFIYQAENLRSIKLFRIFDRWGNLIYNKENLDPNSIHHGWDGTFKGESLDPNIYIYHIVVEFNDGFESTYYGEVNLIK